MKKAILILLILAMILSLAACGKSGGPVGTWHIKSAKTGNTTITVDQVPELNSIMGDLVLKEGGTGTMMISGTKYNIKWDDSTITGDDGTRLSYSVSGNTLVLEAFDVTYTYTR